MPENPGGIRIFSPGFVIWKNLRGLGNNKGKALGRIKHFVIHGLHYD